MAQTFTHLLNHMIFSTKERLFSYAPAGLVPLLVPQPRADRPGLLSDAPAGLVCGKHSCVGKTSPVIPNLLPGEYFVESKPPVFRRRESPRTLAAGC